MLFRSVIRETNPAMKDNQLDENVEKLSGDDINSLGGSEESESEPEIKEEKDPNRKFYEEKLTYKYNLETDPSNEKGHSLIIILTKIKDFINKNLQPGKQQTNELKGKSFSQEILWLAGRIRKVLNKRMIGKDSDEVKQINNCTSSLIVCILQV